MARFLSAAWFNELALARANGATDRRWNGSDSVPDLVVQQIVTDSPDGEVRYWVLVADRQTTVRPGQAERSDVTFTEDYRTAAAIARGELSTQSALLAGRIHVAGDLSALASRQDGLISLDLLPTTVRAVTTF
jgi:putative sterol carrier protein